MDKNVYTQHVLHFRKFCYMFIYKIKQSLKHLCSIYSYSQKNINNY